MRRQIPYPVHDDTGRHLGTQHAVAVLTGRHVDLVRKRVPVVACHVPSKALMVDFVDVERVFSAMPRRKRRNLHDNTQ